MAGFDAGKLSSPKDRIYIGGKIRRLSFIVFKEICCGETEHYGKYGAGIGADTITKISCFPSYSIRISNWSMYFTFNNEKHWKILCFINMAICFLGFLFF